VKILKYELDGDRIRFFTDNPGRSEFVYMADQFSSAKAAEAEINRSIAAEQSRKTSSAAKLEALTINMEKVDKDA
jgi:hypothetical protein